MVTKYLIQTDPNCPGYFFLVDASTSLPLHNFLLNFDTSDDLGEAVSEALSFEFLIDRL